MATASLIQSIFAGLIHPTTGVVLASAKCRFYELGTLVEQTVYSDPAAATPIVQPLTLTAAGQGTVYTLAPVRCIVKDATDSTTIYDVNINIGANVASTFVTSAAWNGGVETTLQTILDDFTTAWGGHAGFWKYKQGGSGSVEVYPKTWLSTLCVQLADFGGVADDATDNSTAFTNAITALEAQGGGVLLLGTGYYRITTPITIGVQGITIRGNGRSNTFIKNMSTTGDVFRYSLAVDYATCIEDLSIIAGTTSTGAAVNVLDNAHGFSFTRMNVTGHQSGFTGATWYGWKFYDVNITTTTSASARGVKGVGAQCHALGGTWTSSAGAALEVSSSLVGVFLAGTTLASTTGNAMISGGAACPLLLGCYVSSQSGDAISAASAVRNIGSQILSASGASVSYTATPFSVTIADGGTTPAVLDGPDYRVRVTGAAAVATVDMGLVAAAAQVGQVISLICLNDSGGAMTWAISNVKLDASAGVPNPSTGRRTTIQFRKDSVDGVLVEVGRSTSVA